MIAIPVMRGRVAPVLNWCSRVLIFPATPEGETGQEFWAPELGPLERLQVLLARGVNTLICGALSADLQNRATQLGLKVIPGVAGEVGEVLKAYGENRLDQPEFWLPGCRGPRRYRQNLGKENCHSITGDQGGEEAMSGGQSGSDVSGTLPQLRRLLPGLSGKSPVLKTAANRRRGNRRPGWPWRSWERSCYF